MTKALTEQAFKMMENQRFGEALQLLRQAIDQDPSWWNVWYLAGQCCRFLSDIDGAIMYLSQAAELKKDESSIFLALGIALQVDEQWEVAIKALRRAIEINPELILAYNSLALTQKKCGQLDKALKNYDVGAKALAWRIVKALQNSRNSPIIKHHSITGTLWLEHVGYAMMYLVSSEGGVTGIAWPTGEQALEEERTESHGGLYWMDIPNEKKETVRLFLPNFFNTFQKILKQSNEYSLLIGNRGTVLDLLGRHD